MTQFTALADLPTILREMGFNVEVATDWLDGQSTPSSPYLWTSPYTFEGSYAAPPFGYQVHHTAGTAATPPNHSDSKANAWIGLYRDGRLYQDGPGVPTIYLATAGPCRVSSGYGYEPAAWDYTFEDRRAPAHAEGPDTDPEVALNRYVFNVEVVHPGDGGPLDPGVWDCVVGLGVALQDMFRWEERTLGHTSWTQRKIDPKWAVGLPHDGADCIVDIQDAIKEATVPTYRTVENVPDADWARNVIDWGIDEAKIIKVDDSHTDDWNANVDYGAMWTIIKRYADNS